MLNAQLILNYDLAMCMKPLESTARTKTIPHEIEEIEKDLLFNMNR